MTETTTWSAQREAESLLGELEARLLHVTATARRAATVAWLLPRADRSLLIHAAWLHDIGYAPVVSDTGLHQLDGARHLRRAGVNDRLCRLVAHHSLAFLEARARGLHEELIEEFPPEHSGVADALTYVDMTTGPRGELFTVEHRLAEIRRRYQPGHVVSRSIAEAAPDICATVARVEAMLAGQPR